MKRRWIKVLLLLLLVALAIGGRVLVGGHHLDFRHLNEHKEELIVFIQAHYLEAALSFIAIYIGAAMFLPGALILTVAGGMVFGVLPTVLFVNIGATAGAIMAFTMARFLIGGWFQERFKDYLNRFNREMSRHGKHYLLTLRLLPIAPFFVINYCAGLTKMPLSTFIWTTSLGIIPGSLIYAFVGRQLRYINSRSDLFSWEILLALLLLSLLALLPVIRHHLQARRR